MLRSAGVLLVFFFCSRLFGQAADPRPAFEIADVHASAKTGHPSMNAGMRAGRFEIGMATMVDLIVAAYGVEPDKVADGPSWLEMDRFDVIAKIRPGTSQPAIRLMLQSLLIDRFKLVVHPDMRPASAFSLSQRNGKPTLKQSDGSGPAGCQRQPPAARGEVGVNCHGLTMDMFAAQVRGAAGDYLPNAVVNNTKLEGAWDFSLHWTPRGGLAAAGTGGITIFAAIENQLGLKLEAKQLPMPAIVVDSVNRKPTANSADVIASLPSSPPPQFEVATIKPTDPQFRGVNIQTPPNGQVNIQGVTLSFLLQTIWFVTPDMIVNPPKWLDADRWDIAAKVSGAPGNPPRTDMDSMIAMVRQLLEDRFSLRTHTEQREVPAWTLVASKPKLYKADPASRSGCKEGPGVDGKDPRIANPALSRLVACRNVTMAQFADLLPNIANALNVLNGSIRSPVLDSTGLDGAYDFTLSFTNGGAPPMAQPARDAASASDPNGTVSLAEAIDRQLGLKLELKKRPAEVLVIDRVEKPLDN